MFSAPARHHPMRQDDAAAKPPSHDAVLLLLLRAGVTTDAAVLALRLSPATPPVRSCRPPSSPAVVCVCVCVRVWVGVSCPSVVR